MKYKKRSLKKQRQRHHFSKKYTASIVQRGGGFMDAIAEVNAIEGRTNTCMAVHPTQPLVAVGDDAGTVTLFEINPLGKGQPKKLAQLLGLPSAVKCVEFHPTLPVVAGACSDRVLMWRFDQINRKEEQEQEERQQQQDVVQQLEPSHTVIVLGLRSKEDVEQELRVIEQNLEEANGKKKAIATDILTIKTNLRNIDKEMMDIYEDKGTNGRPGFRRGTDHLEKMLAISKNDTLVAELTKQLEPLREQLQGLEVQKKSMIIKYEELETLYKSINIFNTEQKLKALKKELDLILTDARDEVSCIAFHPGSVEYPKPNTSYIAVGVNNKIKRTENRIIMYRFEIDPSPVEKLYSFSPILRSESIQTSPHVSLVSFSHDGALFAFVTKSSDGRTVLKVQNFKGAEDRFEYSEFRHYIIEQRAITSLRSYKSSFQYSSVGRVRERQHQFIIGCDDGSLMMTQATTETSNGSAATTKVTELKSMREWNTREAIECVAVHPSLPLLASGSRSAAKLWDIDQREPLESLALQDVKSVGFNQQFFAVCSSDGLGVYSCNSDDYSGFKEKFQKELQEKIKRKELLGQLHTELRDKTLKGKCAICFESMTGPIQPAITSGPEEVVETYLPCGHKFHKKCIEEWFKQGKTCPECRAKNGLPQSTPANVVDKRTKKLGELEQQLNAEDIRALLARRALFAPASPAPASPAPQAESYSSEQQQPPKSDGGKRKNKNKYSRRKNRSKKSKIRRRYSIKK